MNQLFKRFLALLGGGNSINGLCVRAGHNSFNQR